MEKQMTRRFRFWPGWIVFGLICLLFVGCGPAATPATPKVQRQTFRYGFGVPDPSLENVHAGDTLTIPITVKPDQRTTKRAGRIRMTWRLIGPFASRDKKVIRETIDRHPTPAASASVRITDQTPEVAPLKLILPSDLAPGFYATVWETGSRGNTLSGTGVVEIR